MTLLFLDINILLRHLLQDDPVQSPKASAFLKRIEEGEVKVRTADTVIFETVFTLQKAYRKPRNTISEALLPLIELPGIVLPRKRSYRKVFALYAKNNLPFADAYHAVLMEGLNLTEIVTFDTDFDTSPALPASSPNQPKNPESAVLKISLFDTCYLFSEVSQDTA